MISKIRAAKPDDYQAINHLSKQLDYSMVADRVAKEWLVKLIQSKQHQVWVFDGSSHILGWIHVFIAYRLASEPFAEIGGIAINPEHQRDGIGTRLLNHSQQWALANHLTLRVRCNATRQNTLQFYHSAGLAQIKTQQVLEFS